MPARWSVDEWHDEQAGDARTDIQRNEADQVIVDRLRQRVPCRVEHRGTEHRAADRKREPTCGWNRREPTGWRGSGRRSTASRSWAER